MTKNEILNVIMGIPGAQNARANKTNFVAIEAEDGIVKVAVSTALTEATKNHKAFNMEAAVAEYKAWEAEKALREAERANKPVKVKGPNPEAQARRDELDAKLEALPSFTDYTATDIMNALAGQLAENVTVMAIGQSAKRLVDKGIFTMDARKPEGSNSVKKFYTKH